MPTDLTQFQLFQDLEKSDLDIAGPLFSNIDYPADHILFSQGDHAEILYLVIRGELKVNYKPYDSPEITISRIREGDVAGWSTVLGNKNYTASVVSVTDVSLLYIKGNALRDLIKEYPQTGKIILNQLAIAASPRWKDAQNQVKSMLNKGMEISDQEGGKTMNENTSNGFTRDAQLKALIDQLSAYIETYHGGSVEYVSLEKDTLKVHLGGACLGCPLSPATLHGWVEGTIKQFFPEIAYVEAV